MPQNFSLMDVSACLLGFALFALFAFVPGYAVAWIADLLAFRRRTFPVRTALSICLSIGLTPVLAYLPARLLSLTAMWMVLAVIWLAFAWIVIRERGFVMRGVQGIAAVVGLAWLVVGLATLIDLQIGNRLYFSVVAYDYTLRSAIVASISTSGIPPGNPYFYPGHAVALRYHYFWLIPCSLVDQLGGSLVQARQAVIAGTLWVGLGLISLVTLFLRFVHPKGPGIIRRRSLVGIGLLCVTGLDIIPNLLLDAAGMGLPDPEWWNEHVAAWITSVLWVPHHTAALIAGLTALLILWDAGIASGPRRAMAAAIAGLCLATCLGSSIYVAFVLGISLAVWTVITWAKGWRRETLVLIGAGLIGLLGAARQLLDLRGSAAGSGGATAGPAQVFALRVRPFSFSGPWGHGHGWISDAVNFLCLPLNYLLELGVFGAIGVVIFLRMRRQKAPLDRYQLGTATLAITSLLLCTFLRSAVIEINDLGSRGFLIAQFVLLLWAVDVFEDGWLSPRRRFLSILLLLGFASSFYEVGSLRLFPIISDQGHTPRYAWLSIDRNLGRRTLALRTVYEHLRETLPASAVVQHNPAGEPGDLPFGLYADRRAIAESPSCGVVFGGDPRECSAVQADLRPIFDGVGQRADVDRACQKWGITAVLVKDTDPAWRNSASWVWNEEPETANAFVRVFRCSGKP